MKRQREMTQAVPSNPFFNSRFPKNLEPGKMGSVYTERERPLNSLF
ncbi:hypothetical protein COLO4_38445 [Corchorus olitorius]|uniref:Uncharacterized protein n=1 Tax=Corchorus olitorius TaxID=93759 RepID=A0A1R3FV16_9ROSI|nr:hypothetical protein COLO4_38445 [Corchorus olitorius]